MFEWNSSEQRLEVCGFSIGCHNCGIASIIISIHLFNIFIDEVVITLSVAVFYNCAFRFWLSARQKN